MGFQRMAYPTGWENSLTIENQNMDVLVKLEDGYIPTLVLVTTKNSEHLTDQEEIKYFSLGPPFLVIKDLTKKLNYPDSSHSFARQPFCTLDFQGCQNPKTKIIMI